MFSLLQLNVKGDVCHLAWLSWKIAWKWLIFESLGCNEVLLSHWNGGWLATVCLGKPPVVAQPCITGHFLPFLIPLSSPLSASFPVLSITVRLWIPFALFSAPLPTSQFLLFHFNVSLSLCLCHIMLFLMGLHRARMSRHNPKFLCAVLAREVKAGSAFTPHAP